MKILITLVVIAFSFLAQGQELEKEPILKGVGANLTAKGSYYPQFFIRPMPVLEVQIIAAYAYHRPQLNDFDNAVVQGWFWGGGAALITRPLRKKEQDANKTVKGSFRIGYKVMMGQMKIDAEKKFEGDAFEPYTFNVNEKGIKTNYVEVSLGYEMLIKGQINGNTISNNIRR